MILCLGPSGSGKSCLILRLQEHLDPAKSTSSSALPSTSSTSGTDLFRLSNSLVIREVGGNMCQLWPCYLFEESSTNVIYVVDSSAAEQVGAATLLLMQLLHLLRDARGARVLVVVAKCDLISALSLKELVYLMRIDEIKDMGQVEVELAHFDATEPKKHIDKILQWCNKAK